MINRLFTNWNFRRIMYAIVGFYILITSVPTLHWFGIGIGAYFGLMGLFALGCAGGNCYGGSCDIDINKKA